MAPGANSFVSAWNALDRSCLETSLIAHSRRRLSLFVSLSSLSVESPARHEAFACSTLASSSLKSLTTSIVLSISCSRARFLASSLLLVSDMTRISSWYCFAICWRESLSTQNISFPNILTIARFCWFAKKPAIDSISGLYRAKRLVALALKATLSGSLSGFISHAFIFFSASEIESLPHEFVESARAEDGASAFAVPATAQGPSLSETYLTMSYEV